MKVESGTLTPVPVQEAVGAVDVDRGPCRLAHRDQLIQKRLDLAADQRLQGALVELRQFHQRMNVTLVCARRETPQPHPPAAPVPALGRSHSRRHCGQVSNSTDSRSALAMPESSTVGKSTPCRPPPDSGYTLTTQNNRFTALISAKRFRSTFAFTFGAERAVKCKAWLCAGHGPAACWYAPRAYQLPSMRQA